MLNRLVVRVRLESRAIASVLGARRSDLETSTSFPSHLRCGKTRMSGEKTCGKAGKRLTSIAAEDEKREHGPNHNTEQLFGTWQHGHYKSYWLRFHLHRGKLRRAAIRARSAGRLGDYKWKSLGAERRLRVPRRFFTPFLWATRQVDLGPSRCSTDSQNSVLLGWTMVGLDGLVTGWIR